MPSPPKLNDVRLRRALDGALPSPRWPVGYSAASLRDESDARDLHALLVSVFGDEDPDFGRWWASRSGDAEYDPALVILVRDATGCLAGAALSWTSGFLKDLAVAPYARRKGLAEALLSETFRLATARELPHIDLKTNRIDNAAAYALYLKARMFEVDWAG